MKRNDKSHENKKRLLLNKQTLRELKPTELERSAGGAFQDDIAIGDSDTCPC